MRIRPPATALASLTPALLLTGCTSIGCLLGLNTRADGTCALPEPEACEEGQLRDATGACRDPEGFAVGGGDTGGGGGGGGGGGPIDTAPFDGVDPNPPGGGPAANPGASPCAYTVWLQTDDFPEEFGIRITDGVSSPLAQAPGSITAANQRVVFDVELAAGGWSLELADSFGDGWTAPAGVAIYHAQSGGTVLTATLNGTDSGTFPFSATCAAP
jgi:hypothetical protein